MTGTTMRKVVRWGVVVVWTGLLVGVLSSVSRRTHESAVSRFTLVDEPPFAGLSPEFMDVVSIGHRGIVDDVLLFHTLNYLMDPKIKSTDPLEVVRALKATTRLRPRIESIYMFGCLVLAIDMKKPEYCEPLIMDGISLFPEGWRLPVTLGTVLFYNIKDDGRAAIFYEMASSRPYAPGFTKSFAAKLRQRASLEASDIDALARALGPVLGERAIRDFYSSQQQLEDKK